MWDFPQAPLVRKASFGAALTAVGMLAACSKTADVDPPAPQTTATAAGATVVITDAWARATPPGAAVGAAYLTLRNDSAAGDKLLSMETPLAGAVEIHSMDMAGGVMKMRQLHALDLPSKQTVRLAPGGLHLMLMDLRQPLAAGETFPMTLRFEKSAPVKTTLNVMPIG